MKDKVWLTGPALFIALVCALLATWAILDPAVLVRNFDQGGYSPFELATLPFFAAIVPLVWWRCPFDGGRARRTVLCLMVSMVAAMAIVKELDLHIMFLRALYPEFVDANGGMAPGLFKPDGRPRTGTPFKMRVLTNSGVPFGMKLCILAYFGAFFGLFAAGFAYLFPRWLKGVFRLDAASWAWGCFGASGVMVQISDRLPAWLGHGYGLDKHSSAGVTGATSLCTCLEEGGEMMIAVFALLTIWLSNRTLRMRGRE